MVCTQLFVVFLFVIALVDGVENFCDKNVVFYVFMFSEFVPVDMA
jgi:hypothetical protein